MTSTNRKCILVVGMHRSGTSAMAGVLQILGFDLGNNLLGANEHNVKGYFEHNEVLTLNDKILWDLGISWHTSYLLEEGWEKDPHVLKMVERISTFLRSNFSESQFFALKDPRLSVLLPLWYLALSREGIDVTTIIMIRHPYEVARSWSIPHPKIEYKGTLLWIDYNLRIEKFSRNHSRIYVEFQEFLAEPEKTIERIVGLTPILPKTVLQNKGVAKFLQIDLAHQRLSKADYSNIAHSEALELWDVLCQLVLSDDYELHAKMDERYQNHINILKDYGEVYQRSKDEQVHFQTVKNQNLTHQLNLISERISSINGANADNLDLADQIDWVLRRLEDEREDSISQMKQQKIEMEKGFLEIERLRSDIDHQVLRNEEYEGQLQDASAKIEVLKHEIMCTREELKREKMEMESIRMNMVRKLEQIISDRDTQSNMLEISNNKLSILQRHSANLERDNQDLRSSVSFRLGWMLTRPLVFLNRPFRWFFANGTSFRSTFFLILKKPIPALKLLSWRNMKVLYKALNKEPVDEILRNFSKAVETTEAILEVDKDPNGLHYYVDLVYNVNNIALVVKGWLLTNDELQFIHLLHNGNDIYQLNTGVERPDVTAAFPYYKNSKYAGFYLNANMDIDLNESSSSLQLLIKTDKTEQIIDLKWEFTKDYQKLDLNEQYQVYKTQNKHTESDLRRMVKEIGDFQYNPKISIITPVYNVEPHWLDLCIKSVINQLYQNWELCLYDDASTNPDTRACLSKWQHVDERIKVKTGANNLHISESSNRALEMATGEFVALLDNDDEITRDALFEVVKALNKDRTLDFIYSDEDKVTIEGELVDPHFKPDWSPETMESMMYTCHLGVYRRKLIESIGGFRKGLEGSQDYDLVLRFTEKTDKIYHIPKVLYHWRMIPGSAAASTDAKGYAYEAAIMALKDKLEREGSSGNVVHGKWLGSYRIKRNHEDPRVSIIIPFKDQMELTLGCIKSILKSTYNNYDILLVSNQSSESALRVIKEKISGDPRITLLYYNNEFNFSKINNWCVEKTDAEYLIFLNNDTEVITKDWIESMLEIAVKENIGAVGAKLLYRNNNIQHAGVILGIVGIGNHAFRHQPGVNHGYFGYSNVVRNYSAVTGACLMVSRAKFLSVGGFDPDLKIAYNDIDFCLRLLEKGYRNVYTPFAELFHFESTSRGLDRVDKVKLNRLNQEVAYFEKKWPEILHRTDPYYNPNLTQRSENFSLKI